MVNQANMVLRTVYLPRELDNELRDYAFFRGVSKGEIVRMLVQAGLKANILGGRTGFADGKGKDAASESSGIEKAGARTRKIVAAE